MKKLIYILGSMILLAAANSCYKDKGNYDYLTLDKILIDTSNAGILADYAVYRYDTLKIEPKIFLNDQPVTSEEQVKGKLSFTWSIFQATVGSTVYTRDTLSNSIHLKAEITKPSGKWIVHLAVKDLVTNVETYQRFNLEIAEAISDGWMVLYERNGHTDVGLIVDDRVKRGTVTPRLFLDLIKNSNGYALYGKPVSILHSAAPLSSGEVLVASENDLVGADKSSFGITFPFSKLFFNAPSVKSIQYLTGNLLRKEMVINENKVHCVNFSTSGLFRINHFATPIGGEYGQLENWAPTFYGGSYDAVVYDKTNKRFLHIPTNGVSISRFPAQVSGTEFNVDEVGLDLKAFDWGLTNYEYSIMSNATNTYLLVSNFMGATNNAGLRKIDMSSSPHVQEARTMASALAGQYVLYGANSAVYLFKYNSGQPAGLLWSAPAGEEITCIKLQKFYHQMIHQTLLPNQNQVVYIATWNAATQNGKVYSYLIDPSNGSIDMNSERITEGYGKVKDMSYKWNL